MFHEKADIFTERAVASNTRALRKRNFKVVGEDAERCECLTCLCKSCGYNHSLKEEGGCDGCLNCFGSDIRPLETECSIRGKFEMGLFNE